ncbi:hypothetical protein [Streptomyces erythrochromogenes]|uniref:hypothetical protein n=1 Tax=Streptomyces erythrochromogenes TaxID=285574 RepID=UPI000AE9E9BB|nr:hypothetical protein [Streptomyces erythrochromogenes]
MAGSQISSPSSDEENSRPSAVKKRRPCGRAAEGRGLDGPDGLGGPGGSAAGEDEDACPGDQFVIVVAETLRAGTAGAGATMRDARER